MCGVERPFLDEQDFSQARPLFSLVDDRTEPNRSIFLHTRGESLPLSLSLMLSGPKICCVTALHFFDRSAHPVAYIRKDFLLQSDDTHVI